MPRDVVWRRIVVVRRLIFPRLQLNFFPDADQL